MTWRFIHIPKCGGMSFRKAYEDMENQLQPTHDPAWCFPDERTVAVIRHPLDRLVSIYAHANGSLDGFREWIDTDRWKEWPVIEVCKSANRCKMATSLPQAEWVTADTHLILFERYQHGINEWADLAGVERREIPHRNVSKGRDGARWDDLLREDQSRRLWDYYAEDFRLRQSIFDRIAGTETARHSAH